MVIAEKISRNADMVAALLNLVKIKIVEILLIKIIKKLQEEMKKIILMLN